MNITEPLGPATPNGGTATLDPERTDQLRTFLVVEAAADLAQARSARQGRAGTTVRRLAIGGMAAALLVVSLIALDAGTRSNDHRAEAISITREDGWTTLKLNDPGADADDVLAELHAAGIRAKAVPDGTNPAWEVEPGSGIAATGVGTEAAETLESREQAPPGTILEIMVQYSEPDAASIEEAPPTDEPFTRADQEARDLKIGVKTDFENHTVSIRNSDDHPVTLVLAS